MTYGDATMLGRAMASRERIDRSERLSISTIRASAFDVCAYLSHFFGSLAYMLARKIELDGGRPTDAELRQGMNGVICRCMTYYRIQAAIKRAATSMTAAGAAAGTGGVA